MWIFFKTITSPVCSSKSSSPRALEGLLEWPVCLLSADSSSTWCPGWGRRATMRCLSEGGQSHPFCIRMKTVGTTRGFHRRCQYLTEHPISFLESLCSWEWGLPSRLVCTAPLTPQFPSNPLGPRPQEERLASPSPVGTDLFYFLE